MRTIALIIAALALASPVRASDAAATDSRDRGDRVYKNLHQAAGYLEAFASGNCFSGTVRAKGYLGSAGEEIPKGVDSELEKLFNELQLAREGIHSSPVAVIEKLREKLHTLGVIRGFEHQHSWHMEFQACL